MKKTILIILLSSLFAQAGEEITIRVKGMVCAFCAQGIEKNFKAQPEVDKVQVSLENKFVKLIFKDGKKMTNEKIREILKDAGYDATFEAIK